jgi:hypothetical protein
LLRCGGCIAGVFSEQELRDSSNGTAVILKDGLTEVEKCLELFAAKAS